METLLRKRNNLVATITRLEVYSNQVDHDNIDYDDLDAYYESLEEVKKEFKTIHHNILAKSTDEDLEQHENIFAVNDSLCIKLKSKFMKLKKTNVLPQSNQDATHNGDVRLPKLDLPTFSGNINEWLSFQDLFNTTIHNNFKLSGAQKLQYLKASLKGDAASLLNAFQVTDDNYIEAWNILVQRYENKKEMVHSHLKRLFNQPSLQHETHNGLRKLVDTTTECLRSLKVLHQPTEYWDTLVVYIVSEKLDSETRRNWELSQLTDDIPTLDILIKFLDQRARALSAAGINKQNVTPAFKNQYQKPSLALYGSTSNSCILCSQNHVIFQCQDFLKLTIPERREIVKKHSICFNCLNKGHSFNNCKGGKCKYCNRNHNTLLHSHANNEKQSHNGSLASHFSNDNNNTTQVLLSTANVFLTDIYGQKHQFRALLDNGSQTSFITEKCAQQLQLKQNKINLPISGIGFSSLGKISKIANSTLSSDKNDFSINMKMRVVSKITGLLPHKPLDYKNWSHLQGLNLADPLYYESRHVDLLLGADVYGDIILGGKIIGSETQPKALNSVFGWTVLGSYNAIFKSNINSINAFHIESDVDATIQKFWALEEIPQKRIFTSDEKVCEEHFTTTHSRDHTGRYTVRLPFKKHTKELGESRSQAVCRLKQMERKYSKQTQKRQEYNDVLQEYITMGHMELVADKDIHKDNSSIYYLPHHAVIKEESTTTKLRVVFDASAKTTTGISLNEKLLTGPKLQDDLISILLRFRKHKIAFTADIEKMYRQFLVHKDDTDFQRIVWRKHESEPIKDYRLLTATFGTASAPYSAVKCIQQLAKDEQQNFPDASKIIQEDMYVDDMTSGAETETKALNIQQQLLKIMARGKLSLRKWSSNSKAVLENLPMNMRASQTSLNLDKDNTVKTLGLWWNTSSDCFTFSVVLPIKRNQDTKRNLLSDMGKIYDPMGFLSPVTINVKILFQNLWRINMDWDQHLPPDYQKIWHEYRDSLEFIKNITIPRCVIINNCKSVELHGFSDASEKAYAAVIYARTISHEGDINVKMLAAKTKVAPLKQISLPRLELCGALLLSRLVELTTNSMKLKIDKVACYSDSNIVLAWIDSPPQRWKTFVANRVSEIQDITHSSQWCYVRSEDNPADCASRGISSKELLTHKLWWHGPEWLQNKEAPVHEIPELLGEIPEEKKITITVNHININSTLLSKFSSLSKLQRVTAYLKRFIHNRKLKNLTERRAGILTVHELDEALIHWIKFVQSEEFSLEKDLLEHNKIIAKNSKFLNLSPFLDNKGILRVGGRLKNSEFTPNQRNPILLPKRNVLTNLIVDHYHKTTLHAGPQLLLATIQRKFWIIGGKDVINHFVRKCITCFRHRANVSEQMMGELPAARVNPARPFLRCGVDYGGPFIIKNMKGRKRQHFKSYICLFVCFVTRAIHLELVSDLSTDSFLAALKRFISRRGIPTDIYSDCATNFVGADHELKEFLKLLQSSGHNAIVSNYLGEKSIKWHFSPPSAPHFGGLWEAGIKSTKYHLVRVIGNAVLTFEEFSTFLTQVEACLNSRPLTAMSPDPADLSTLTPGHFLIGDALIAIPEPDYSSLKENHLSRWQYTQKLLQHFWKRWSSEFLSRLQQRPKWNRSSENLKINQLVLIKDERLPPLHWKLARIIDIHPGEDQLVRVATIKTADSTFKRPVAKLCPLPMEN